MMAVWVAQAMWWVAQAMWWEGCAGYVVVPRSKIIPLRGPTCKIARFQAKLKFPSWTECGKNIPYIGLMVLKVTGLNIRF